MQDFVVMELLLKDVRTSFTTGIFHHESTTTLSRTKIEIKALVLGEDSL